MLPSYADNAILAKVRAMYGRRLTLRDYDQLMAKKTVGEVAAYLKNETAYADCLREVREELIHREQLENLVRRSTLDTYTRLLKYTYRENLFLRLYLMQSEAEQLLTAIRLLNSGGIERYIITMPVHLAKLLSFDLFAIAKARSFDDLLAIVEHSDYYRILGRFRPGGTGKPVDITACEAALLTHCYREALALVDRDYRGGTRDDLRRLLIHRVDLHNISLICRMRRFRDAPRQAIEPLLLQVEGMDRRLAVRLMDAPDKAAITGVLRSSASVRRHVALDWELDSQRLAGQRMGLRRQMNQRLFRFSTKPVVVVLCYMTLLEIEHDNIVHIIEGIRYGVPQDQLRHLVSV